MAVPIRAEPTFRAGSPQALFELPETPEEPTLLFEDVTQDGQKFLINFDTSVITPIPGAVVNVTGVLVPTGTGSWVLKPRGNADIAVQ